VQRHCRCSSVDRLLELLGCAEVVHMLQVRSVGSLLGQQVVDPGHDGLQMFHSSARHRPGLAKGSDRMRSEIIKSV
jgi:hypothetical protein